MQEAVVFSLAPLPVDFSALRQGGGDFNHQAGCVGSASRPKFIPMKIPADAVVPIAEVYFPAKHTGEASSSARSRSASIRRAIRPRSRGEIITATDFKPPPAKSDQNGLFILILYKSSESRSDRDGELVPAWAIQLENLV